ncbi:C2 domain-containing protein [Mycotypha africana]|uniref:C2 domain-containing protein n=1 Tax=Mycotypha africana TaxID=64632 RepID=UPI002301EC36|nr:C2 domain-containing protein [Mycotypha africana]KAI8991134.1 C2 domain-containing protein [Mycotypha africana]
MFGYSTPKGVLTVKLIEGQKLHKEDSFGHNDAYVELWFNDDYKQKSEVFKNSENPVWNNTFVFNIAEGSHDHKLKFKVLDKDVADDDKIGEGSLDCKPAFEGEVMDEWVKLPAKLGLTSHGELHFQVQFSPE